MNMEKVLLLARRHMAELVAELEAVTGAGEQRQKSLPARVKAKCEPGQTAAQTDCTPASGQEAATKRGGSLSDPLSQDEKDAVQAWATSSWGKIKGQQKQQPAGELARQFNQALSKLPPVDVPTYRGIALHRNLLDKYRVGADVMFETSESFSKNRDWAEGWAVEHPKVFGDTSTGEHAPAVFVMPPTKRIRDIAPALLEGTGKLQEEVVIQDHTLAKVTHRAVLNGVDYIYFNGAEKTPRNSEEKSLPARTKQHWVTIGGSPAVHGGRHEEHHGGTPVELDSEGRIEKGPATLKGKKPSELHSNREGSRQRIGRPYPPPVKPSPFRPDEPKPAKAPEALEERLEEKPHEEQPAEPTPAPEPGGGAGSAGAGAEPAAGSGPVEEAAGGAGSEAADQGGGGDGKPAGAGAARRVPASAPEVDKRLDRFERFFRDKGQHEVAGWMGKLREHVSKVGTEAALKALGEEGGLGDNEDTAYEGGWDDMPQFCKAYLDRNGIIPLGVPGVTQPEDPNKVRLISSASPSQGASIRDPYLVGDFVPKDPTIKDKLEESQALPGLEKSEDINKLMGRPVTHLTPDVLEKMDEVYGKGQWIIKAYGDEAAAGYGIFFPQRASQIPQDARNAIWQAGENLAKYGFQIARDKDGDPVGIKHEGGKQYDFGTEEFNSTIQGDARKWADSVAKYAGSEKAAKLPGGGKDFMAQPAFEAVGISDEERARGVTGSEGGKGEGRTHIVTRNGKAELIPHSTWIKGENLPVVFEDDNTRAMAQAALDAINALPESERQGQIYAPDIMPTKQGYKVVEANPANKTGSSGYLGNSPYIIDSYVSHLTGREPAHVRFIRKLLSNRKRGEAGGKSLPVQIKSGSHQGEDCKPGWTAAATGCNPTSGETPSSAPPRPAASGAESRPADLPQAKVESLATDLNTAVNKAKREMKDKDWYQSERCAISAMAFKLVHPEAEIWGGHIASGGTGTYHVINKIGDYYIDATGGQFGFPRVQVWKDSNWPEAYNDFKPVDLGSSREPAIRVVARNMTQTPAPPQVSPSPFKK